MSKKQKTLEEVLQDKLQAIFDVSKVTYDDPGADNEQECLFIQIESSRNRVRNGKFTAMVRGRLIINAQATKMPIGYLSKCINAHANETKDLFFYDFEENTKLYNNIVQRGVSFVYLFDSQYDPATGTMNSLITVEVSP